MISTLTSTSLVILFRIVPGCTSIAFISAPAKTAFASSLIVANILHAAIFMTAAWMTVRTKEAICASIAEITRESGFTEALTCALITDLLCNAVRMAVTCCNDEVGIM